MRGETKVGSTFEMTGKLTAMVVHRMDSERRSSMVGWKNKRRERGILVWGKINGIENGVK